MRLNAKTAIVTGGARGIGRAAAELFAEEGAAVWAADLSLDEPVEHPGITFVPHDVTSQESWASLVERVLDESGRVDVLVNNAGLVGSYEGVETIDLDDWRRIIDVNLNGVFLGTRAVIPVMRAGGGGSIVHTSSMWGIVGAVGVAAYTASKAAVRSLSKNVALTYAADGIRSNSVHPGIIETPMVLAQDAALTQGIVDATPLRRLGTAREIAYGMLYLASDEANYVTGAELVIDGGSTAQ